MDSDKKGQDLGGIDQNNASSFLNSALKLDLASNAEDKNNSRNNEHSRQFCGRAKESEVQSLCQLLQDNPAYLNSAMSSMKGSAFAGGQGLGQAGSNMKMSQNITPQMPIPLR